jgi:hypothetical protein
MIALATALLIQTQREASQKAVSSALSRHGVLLGKR